MVERDPKGRFLKGHRHSIEVKKKISESHKGKSPWNKDKKYPSQSERMKGENNPNYGKMGKDNPNWKGNDAGYGKIHTWIRLHWGEATHCEICHTKEAPLYEWHNKDKRYKRIREDWIQVCRKCHMRLEKELKEEVWKKKNLMLQNL